MIALVTFAPDQDVQKQPIPFGPSVYIRCHCATMATSPQGLSPQASDHPAGQKRKRLPRALLACESCRSRKLRVRLPELRCGRDAPANNSSAINCRPAPIAPNDRWSAIIDLWTYLFLPTLEGKRPSLPKDSKWHMVRHLFTLFDRYCSILIALRKEVIGS